MEWVTRSSRVTTIGVLGTLPHDHIVKEPNKFRPLRVRASFAVAAIRQDPAFALFSPFAQQGAGARALHVAPH